MPKLSFWTITIKRNNEITSLKALETFSTKKDMLAHSVTKLFCKEKRGTQTNRQMNRWMGGLTYGQKNSCVNSQVDRPTYRQRGGVKAAARTSQDVSQ